MNCCFATAVAAALSLSAGPSIAYQGDAAGESATVSAKERVICKTAEQIGSGLKKSKSCRTSKEWKAAAQSASDRVRAAQSSDSRMTERQLAVEMN